MKKIYLATGKNAENIIKKPFQSDDELKWVLQGDIEDNDYSSQKDELGNLNISLWPDNKEELKLECLIGEAVKEEYEVCLVDVPEEKELTPGEFFEITFPDEFPVLGLYYKTFKKVSASSDPIRKKVIVKAVNPGFEKLEFFLEQDELASVKFSIPVRVLDPESGDDLPSEPQAAKEPQTAQELPVAKESPEAQTPPEFPKAEEFSEPQEISEEKKEFLEEKKGDSYNEPLVHASVTPTKEECKIEVSKINENQLLSTVDLIMGKSVFVGKASSSAKGFADINLAPYLSDNGKKNCSRRQLKIYINADNRICVKNIGARSVKVNNNVLQPDIDVLISPESAITIADEVLLLFKERV